MVTIFCQNLYSLIKTYRPSVFFEIYMCRTHSPAQVNNKHKRQKLPLSEIQFSECRYKTHTYSVDFWLLAVLWMLHRVHFTRITPILVTAIVLKLLSVSHAAGDHVLDSFFHSREAEDRSHGDESQHAMFSLLSSNWPLILRKHQSFYTACRLGPDRQKTWLVLTSLDIHSSYVPILLNNLYRIIFHVALSLQVDIHTVRINNAGMTCRE